MGFLAGAVVCQSLAQKRRARTRKKEGKKRFRYEPEWKKKRDRSRRKEKRGCRAINEGKGLHFANDKVPNQSPSFFRPPVSAQHLFFLPQSVHLHPWAKGRSSGTRGEVARVHHCGVLAVLFSSTTTMTKNVCRPHFFH